MVGGILVVVAHPDDETLGCGGTLALHANKGQSVEVLCLTCDPPVRRGEYIQASKALGVAEPTIFMDKEVTPSNSLTRRISDVIVSRRPRVIVTHLPFDYHREHKLVYGTVKEATEWAAHTTAYPEPWLVDRLLLMEVNTLIPSPHVLVDVTESFGKKMEALRYYKSQLGKFPWSYYERFSLKKAELRGTQADCGFAEAFLEEPLAKCSPFYEAKRTESVL
jgi:LmbE family N-acetylglucosaminyl deacetylase